MEVKESLPNLKISVDNTDGGPNSAVEVKDYDENMCSSDNDDSNIKVAINLDSFAPKIKKYENPIQNLYEGQDTEHIEKKLKDRASRFGLRTDGDNIKMKKISDDDIKDIYHELQISSLEIKNGFVRPEALHVRGVDNMSTENIFSYFNNFFPKHIEWINDASCNVIWEKEEDAAKAIISLGIKTVCCNKIFKKPSEEEDNKDSCDDISENTDKKISDSEDIMDETEKSIDKADDADSENISNSFDFAVPPGCWRLGVEHSNSKAILLRFATKDDKKVKGAEKLSSYYKKNGNPNYNGMKGIISNSRRRKIRSRVDDNLDSQFVTESIEEVDNTNDDSDDEYISDVKIPRRQMYADIEENKRKRKDLKAKAASIDASDRSSKPDLRAVINMRKKTKSRFDRNFSSESDPSEESNSEEDLRNEISKQKIKPSLRSRLGHVNVKNEDHKSPLLRE